MEHEKQDRRTRRTRQLLRDTFVTLLKEKRYEDISVQDIIERADVARSTFYVHYVDKEDLLVGKWGVFASNLGAQADVLKQEESDGHSILSTLGWFRHIEAQGDLLKIIAKDPAMDLAMKTLHGILLEDMQKRIERHLPENENAPIPPSLAVEYLAGSLMTLLKWWVKQGMSYPPERMDEIFQQLVMRGVSSMIKTKE
jgi:AcrR family transcriptional regulator